MSHPYLKVNGGSIVVQVYVYRVEEGGGRGGGVGFVDEDVHYKEELQTFHLHFVSTRERP